MAAGAVLAVQVPLAGLVLGRMARTAQGTRIPAAADGGERVSVLVPVLNERHRLGPCLDGLAAQGGEAAEILVVDGGSTDGTQELVERYAARDRRFRLVDASPVPAGWNGKAHGLQVGLDRTAAETAWVLTIDADVRPAPALARSLVAFARREGVPALSAATLQEVSGPGEAALHPALLTTLVYRFGIPGHATDRVAAAQANGQCFLLRRDVLAAVGGFAPTRDSVCEDVTLARTLAAAGHRVGFYETDGLVSVAMYAGWRDAWTNWTRSLPMRDRYSGLSGWVGLAEVALVQAAPLPVVVAVAVALWRGSSRGRGGTKPTGPRPGIRRRTRRSEQAARPPAGALGRARRSTRSERGAVAAGGQAPRPKRSGYRTVHRFGRASWPERSAREGAEQGGRAPWATRSAWEGDERVGRAPWSTGSAWSGPPEVENLGRRRRSPLKGAGVGMRSEPARAQLPLGGLRSGSPGFSTPSGRGRDARDRQPSNPSRALALLARVNLLLALVRLGVLLGTARGYTRRPWAYWLSPLCDVPAAVGVSLSAVRRRHAWRGRPIVRGGPG